MKAPLILCLLFCACSAPASGSAPRALQLRVQVTTGERSKDSSSQTTTISITSGAKTIVWEETSSGGRRTTPHFHKEYELTPADLQKLIQLLESKRLLVTKSIELPRDLATYQYFVISIESALRDKKGAIRISGPRTAVEVKEQKLYQDSMALIKELYRIVNSHGGSVGLRNLVAAKRGPPQIKPSPITSKEIQ